MIPGREACKDELINLARNNGKIVCLEADLGGHNNAFQQNFPQRFFNIGIAEHTMLGVAAGLSKLGFIPYAHTFAPFAILRAAEMVKLCMSYMGLNIKLICPYGGVSGAWFGPTHHCLEDFGILQTLPGISICAPHGEQEAREIMQWSASYIGAVYIRLGRNAKLKNIRYLDSLQYPLPRRVAEQWYDAECLLLSVGEMGTELVNQYELQGDNVKYPHLHAPFIDRKALTFISTMINNYQKVVVVEEARMLGGIASSLALLNPRQQIFSFCISDIWPSFGGTHEEMLAQLGFSVTRLIEFLDKL